MLCLAAAAVSYAPPALWPHTGGASTMARMRRVADVAMRLEAEATYRRAEFWDSESCSLLEVVNVLGRWERADEWSERTEFTEVEGGQSSQLQAGTRKRYEMARRTGTVERIAMQQNVKRLPFRDAALARGLGLSVAEMDAVEVTPAAVDVVYDALSQSKASLLPPDTLEARRSGWLAADGAFDAGAFAASLYKARVAVIASWFVFGKGNLVGLLVVLKVSVPQMPTGRPRALRWPACSPAAVAHRC